jgi:hypothetical protein
VRSRLFDIYSTIIVLKEVYSWSETQLGFGHSTLRLCIRYSGLLVIGSVISSICALGYFEV